MSAFDRRLTPARPDLAASFLRGKVEAARFVEGKVMRVMEPAIPMRGSPRGDAMLDTEVLYGEDVIVFDDEEGFAWVQAERDSYVGYVPAAALGRCGAAPTHRVTALRTFLYPGPNMKLPALGYLPMNARLVVTGEANGFAATDCGGFVHGGHLAPLTSKAADFVAVAERFVGTPYLWGGRSSLGLDCSGLVQTALDAAGIAAPRDSDMQEKALGHLIGTDPRATDLARGDLIFWKGHVGILASPSLLLHANGHHMAVVVEPLREAVARIAAKSFGAVTAIRRIAPSA